MRIVGGERAWAAAFEISAMQIGVTVINDLRTVGMIERHDMLCGYANNSYATGSTDYISEASGIWNGEGKATGKDSRKGEQEGTVEDKYIGEEKLCGNSRAVVEQGEISSGRLQGFEQCTE